MTQQSLPEFPEGGLAEDAFASMLDMVAEDIRSAKQRKPLPADEPKRSEWVDAPVWTKATHVLRVNRTSCDYCGEASAVVEGVYLEEVAPRNGARRLSRMEPDAVWETLGSDPEEPQTLDPLPKRVEVTNLTSSCCVQCGFVFGFDPSNWEQKSDDGTDPLNVPEPEEETRI